jgi:perosamine synthetase
MADQFDKTHRENLLHHLKTKGIGCSNYFTPIHLQSHYQALGWKYGDMPITEKVSERTIALPFFNNLKEDRIAIVTTAVKDFFLKDQGLFLKKPPCP